MRLRYDDKAHSYWQDGKRARGISSVAKIPDDTYRLNLYKMRNVAVGLATDPLLLERVAAHIDDPRTLDDLCEEASAAAGGNRAADRGTAAHRITETIDAGLPLLPTPLAVSVGAAWRELCDAHGLVVVPDLIERIVGYPERRLWGRFDRIMSCAVIDGELAVVDVKTGARALDYPHSHAIQLALYANADVMASPFTGSGETDVFEPMPPVRRDVAYVAHLPEDGAPRLVAIDIAAGWQAFERIVLPTLDWRARKDLARSITPTGAAPTGAPAGAATTASAPPAPAVVARGARVPGVGALAPHLSEADEAALRHDVLSFVGQSTAHALALSSGWPAGVPGIRRPEQRHTAADAAAIRAAIEAAGHTIASSQVLEVSAPPAVELSGPGVVPNDAAEPSADAGAYDFGGERRRVFDYVHAAGVDGRTSHEIVAAGLVPNVNRCGTRLQELRGEAKGWHGKGVIGHVLDADGSPVLRANAAGNTAAVHVALEHEPSLPPGYRLSRGPRPYEPPPVAPQTALDGPTLDEGGPADPLGVKALGERYRALDEGARLAVDRITKGAAALGVSVSIQDRPTVRRFEIGRALLAWAEWDATDDALEIALAVALRLDGRRDRWPATMPELVGRLTAAQAVVVTDVFVRLGEGAPLVFNDDGRPLIGARP